MEIKPIKTESDYRVALSEIETLMMAEADTPEGERLDILATLVEAYERKHYALDLPDPIEAIKFCMDQKGLSPKDLEPMIGKRNRVYDILNHKRPLTLKMIWRLHKELGIPAECLIQQRKCSPPSRSASVSTAEGGQDAPLVSKKEGGVNAYPATRGCL